MFRPNVLLMIFATLVVRQAKEMISKTTTHGYIKQKQVAWKKKEEEFAKAKPQSTGPPTTLRSRVTSVAQTSLKHSKSPTKAGGILGWNAQRDES